MEKILLKLKEKPWLASLILLIPSLLVMAQLKGAQAPQDLPPVEEPPVIDTFIPDGMVLVPIEVANSDSLDSMLGKFGMVDLYPSSWNPESQSRPLARGVKILRAPKNPSQFAVLVAEQLAPALVRQGPAYFVIVQNPNRPGMGFEKAPVRPKAHVVYDEEEE